MKVYNEIITKFNETTQQWETIYEDSFDYEGEMYLLTDPYCQCANNSDCTALIQNSDIHFSLTWCNTSSDVACADYEWGNTETGGGTYTGECQVPDPCSWSTSRPNSCSCGVNVHCENVCIGGICRDYANIGGMCDTYHDCDHYWRDISETFPDAPDGNGIVCVGSDGNPSTTSGGGICTDTLNYFTTGGGTEDGSEEEVITNLSGCTNPNADNYHPDRIIDDGTCNIKRENSNLGGWINTDFIDNTSYYITNYTINIMDGNGNIIDTATFEFDVFNFWNTEFVNLIQDGYEYEFTEDGIYTVEITATGTDTSITNYVNDIYKFTETFTVLNVIEINQSLSSNILPYQGINLDLTDFSNTKEKWELSDNDGRPSLGCFYYDEENLLDYNFVFEGVNTNDNNFNQLTNLNLLINHSGDFIETENYSPECTKKTITTTCVGGVFCYNENTGTDHTSSYPNSTQPQSCTDDNIGNQCHQDVSYSAVCTLDDDCDNGYGYAEYEYEIVDEEVSWSESDHHGALKPRNWTAGSISGIGVCEDGDGDVIDDIVTQGECLCFNNECSGRTWNPCPRYTTEDQAYQHAYWIRGDDCMSGGVCLKMNYNTGGYNDEYGVNSKFMTVHQTILPDNGNITDTFGWGVGTTIYVSWWQKTNTTGFNNSKKSSIGILNTTIDGHTNFAGNDNSNGEIDTPARSDFYSNSVANKWEKFEFTFSISEDWDLTGGVSLYVYGHVDDVSGTIYYDNFEVREGGNFIPDVDVRKSNTSNYISPASLLSYWDEDINPIEYEDTLAPLEVQFYFYPRFELNNIFGARNVISSDFENGNFYITNIDWGDGSPKEFIVEPVMLGNDIALNHTYKKYGIYEITGIMLRVKRDDDNNILGVLHNKQFTVRVNINEGIDNEFKYLGGDGFSFIPYKETVPIIGGISKNSIYYKSIKRQLGHISDTDIVDIDFERVGDKLKTELALVRMDESLIDTLDLLPHFSKKITDTDGAIIYDGIVNNYGELGQSVGDTDIGQIRYFNKPKQIWEMLGFEEDSTIITNHPGNPDDSRYWKNIIPEEYTVNNRLDVTEELIDENSSQEWIGQNEYGNIYYYPVLPKLNKFGQFDGSLGLQTDEYGSPKIPFAENSPAIIDKISDNSLIIDIKSDKIESNIFRDNSGNNIVGVGISDYKVLFDSETDEPKSDVFINKIKASTNKDGAF